MLKRIIFLFCVSSTHAYAQDTPTESYTVSIYGNVGIPSPEFKKAVNNSIGGTAVGFGGNMLFNTGGKKKLSPLAFGVDFSYQYFGRDKIEATSSLPPYKTSYNFWSLSGVSRVILSKRTEGFVPFVDGMMGLKIFTTRTKVDKSALASVLGEEEELVGVKNYNGLGYGIGMGWYTRKPQDQEDNASFSLRVMYLWGDRIKYVKRGSVQVDNGSVKFETGYTYTNTVLIQFGCTIH
ncbi:MAG: hypothetical protein WAZ98_07740 [Cyclobacteriaceae bacterium]